MLIEKRISIASIVVDPENGKIWLNSPNCILRIQDVNFKHIEDKFEMIDIKGKDVFMIPGDLGLSKYSEFLEKLNRIIYPKIYNFSEDQIENFLDNIYDKIKSHCE